MSSFTSKLCSVKNGVTTRMARAMNQAKMISGKGVTTALTVMSSNKGSISLRGAVVAPAALLRTSAPCCAAGEDSDVVELQLKIEGMVCDGCSSRVLEALQKMPGVKNVAVDLEKGVATVELAAASQLDAFNEIPKLIATVTDLGFEAQPHFE